MKDVLKAKYYARDDQVKTAGIKWLNEKSAEFYEEGIHVLI